MLRAWRFRGRQATLPARTRVCCSHAWENGTARPAPARGRELGERGARERLRRVDDVAQHEPAVARQRRVPQDRPSGLRRSHGQAAMHAPAPASRDASAADRLHGSARGGVELHERADRPVRSGRRDRFRSIGRVPEPKYGFHELHRAAVVAMQHVCGPERRRRFVRHWLRELERVVHRDEPDGVPAVRVSGRRARRRNVSGDRLRPRTANGGQRDVQLNLAPPRWRDAPRVL